MSEMFEDEKHMFTNSPFERWANKLAHDKLRMDVVGDGARAQLIELCAELAVRHPKVTCRVHPLHSRRQVCEVAVDLGIDLTAIKSLSRFKRGKPLIGRGLLDVWAVVLKERFGSAVGTKAWFEQKRRDIKMKLAKDHVSLASLYKTEEGK